MIVQKKGNKSDVVKFQKLLLSLFEAKLLAVRKVTQDNRGKRTAGIDGVSLLSPIKRFSLAHNLKIDGRCDPIKRRLIPKLGKPGELRLLGIPTIRDRAKQALALLALEPEWEANLKRIVTVLDLVDDLMMLLKLFTHRLIKVPNMS
jgi:RNA-directed DNA polymerase